MKGCALLLLLLGVVATLSVSAKLVREDPECPEDQETPTFLPFPGDCTKYYECSNGEKLLLECPPGLHFNPIDHVCDWPLEAGCEK